MLKITLVVFAISCVLIPWSNAITGPIKDSDQMPLNITGSGSGSGELPELGYCGYALSQETVNKDSVKRLPASVWAIILITLLLNLTAR